MLEAQNVFITSGRCNHTTQVLKYTGLSCRRHFPEASVLTAASAKPRTHECDSFWAPVQTDLIDMPATARVDQSCKPQIAQRM